MRDLGSSDQAKLTRAHEVAKRAAAIETGAIEGLYQIDRGITITIAMQTAMWHNALEKQQEKVRSLIKCQLEAYDYVLDFATRSVPVAEAWIRELHLRLCSAQETFKALTVEGVQEQSLNHGQYKKLPNHVLKADGSLHAYAPVIQVPIEMGRLCEAMRGHEFEAAHPILQAAYVHHAFTRVHPFQDGNGRVARALASVFLYRGASIPFLVLVDHRDDYINALESADGGNYQVFVNFALARCIDAFDLVAESFRTARLVDPLASSKAIANLYVTKGGYRHNEVDLAGQNFLKLIHVQLQKMINEIPRANELQLTVTGVTGDFSMPPAPQGYRTLVSISKQGVVLQAQSHPPATTTVQRTLGIFVPRDCDQDDEIIISCTETGDQLRRPISGILTANGMITELKVVIFCERVMGEILGQLRQQAEAELKRQGY